MLQLKDVSVQQSVVPCNQISSGNLRTEVIVVVAAAELAAEDVAVVVAVAHCHASCSDDESSDPDNRRHGLSQCFRQLALFVEVQKA